MNNKQAIEIGEKFCEICLFFNTKKTTGEDLNDDICTTKKCELEHIDRKFSLHTLQSCLRIFNTVNYSIDNFIFIFYEEFAGALGIIQSEIANVYSPLSSELFLLGVLHLVIQIESLVAQQLGKDKVFFVSYTLLNFLRKSSIAKDINEGIGTLKFDDLHSNYNQIFTLIEKSITKQKQSSSLLESVEIKPGWGGVSVDLKGLDKKLIDKRKKLMKYVTYYPLPS